MAQLICRQITATSNKLKQSVLLYNSTMKYHTSAASKYPKHLDVMYFHAQMKHLEHVSPVITGDTDTYYQGLFALVKCKQQRIGALYQRSYNKFMHYTTLPAYDMVEDEDEENKEITDDQTEEEVSGEEDEQTEDNVSGEEQDLEDGTGDEEMERATSSRGSQAGEDSGNDSDELDTLIALLDQDQALESSDESETD